MAPKRRGAKRASSTKGGSAQKRGRGAKKGAQEETTEQPDADTSTPQDADTTNQHTDTTQSESKETSTEDKSESSGRKVEGTEGGGPEMRVLEKGHLFFFYRPKVDAQEVKSADDVQKFYVLMSPEGAVGRPAREEDIEGKRGEERKPSEGHEGKALHRLFVISSKTMPDPTSNRPRPWAFIDAVSSDIHEVEQKLERYSYDTKTRGHREIQPARMCGEALYEIVLKGDRESHLAYTLEFPEQPTAVQEAFRIKKQGECSITVKNPAFNSAAYSARWAGFSGDQKARLPPHLMEKFKGKIKNQVRYCMLDTVEFLNYQHCETVWIGERLKDDMQRVLDELEEEVEEEGGKSEEEVYKELQTKPEEFPDAAQKFQ